LEEKWGEGRRDFGEEAENSKKKLPYLVIEKDEDHVPLKEKRRGGKEGRGGGGRSPASSPNSSTSMRGGKLKTQGE
jgi:predicted NUDIX family phosphoesterase